MESLKRLVLRPVPHVFSTSEIHTWNDPCHTSGQKCGVIFSSDGGFAFGTFGTITLRTGSRVARLTVSLELSQPPKNTELPSVVATRHRIDYTEYRPATCDLSFQDTTGTCHVSQTQLICLYSRFCDWIKRHCRTAPSSGVHT